MHNRAPDLRRMHLPRTPLNRLMGLFVPSTMPTIHLARLLGHAPRGSGTSNPYDAASRVEGGSIARNHVCSLRLGSYGSRDPLSGVRAVLLDQLVLVAGTPGTPPGAHYENTLVEGYV